MSPKRRQCDVHIGDANLEATFSPFTTARLPTKVLHDAVSYFPPRDLSLAEVLEMSSIIILDHFFLLLQPRFMYTLSRSPVRLKGQTQIFLS